MIQFIEKNRMAETETDKTSKKRVYSKLQFAREEEEKIITFVKLNPELYDPKNSKFKDKAHKEKLWNDLAVSFNDNKSGCIFILKINCIVILIFNLQREFMWW